ncbi:RICIN domain-containing protein [Streptomyces sp. NPDC057702]|uniref:RICIN domain-containing protein n=1 Tax=unclassified Streptomyces TaxID=2593676 RepID=UPI00369895AB
MKRIGTISGSVVLAAVTLTWAGSAQAAPSYVLKNHKTGLCLTAGSTDGGFATRDCTKGDLYQRFSLVPLDDGTVEIMSEGTGKCLDGSHAGNIYQTTCNPENPYMHWYVTERGTDSYSYRSKGSDLCLDSASDGRAYGHTCNDGEYQVWSRLAP